MTTTTESVTTQRDALGDRMFASLLGGMELLAIQLGIRLSLYPALRDGSPTTSGALAATTGIDERYAREWLEQQAVSGILEVAIGNEDPSQRAYTLPGGHAEALLDPESPGYAGAIPSGLVGLAKTLDELTAVYRTGAGVAYERYGAEMRESIAGFNRPMFANDLAREWLPALPDVHARLVAGAPLRVLDIACGTGWSTIALARSYRNVDLFGIDLDSASIEQARRNADASGVADRVRFALSDAAGAAVEGGFDLAMLFEALHDIGDPVGALRQARSALVPGAPLLVADERVAESFVAPGDEVERLNYGWSVLHCLPATRATSPVIANGTVLRAATVRLWAREAGFSAVEELPIANDFWRFYRLEP
ncbi:MAG: class I SAM-dependent methyltransferase [Pseudonocardiaceae bacterium]